MGMIHRQFKDLDKKTLIFYISFIKPHLEFAIQAWSPYMTLSIWRNYSAEILDGLN